MKVKSFKIVRKIAYVELESETLREARQLRELSGSWSGVPLPEPHRGNKIVLMAKVPFGKYPVPRVRHLTSIDRKEAK